MPGEDLNKLQLLVPAAVKPWSRLPSSIEIKLSFALKLHFMRGLGVRLPGFVGSEPACKEQSPRRVARLQQL